MFGGICSVRAIKAQSVKVPQQSLFSHHNIPLSILVLCVNCGQFWMIPIATTYVHMKVLTQSS